MINSVYLDNSQMELYHGRLLKLPDAIALRIRWYGVGNDPKVRVILRLILGNDPKVRVILRLILGNDPKVRVILRLILRHEVILSQLYLHLYLY